MKKRPKHTRLENLSISDTIVWQERPTKVIGKKRISNLLTCLQLAVVEKVREAHDIAEERDEDPRDVSFWTRPIASGITVERV